MGNSLTKGSFEAILKVASLNNIEKSELIELLTLDANNRVETDSIAKTIEFMILKSNNSNIPLQIGEVQKVQYMGSLGKYILYASDMKQVIDIIEKYHQIIHTGIIPNFIFKEKEIILELDYKIYDIQNIRYPAEGFFSTYVTIFSSLINQKIKINKVEFFHELSSDIKDFLRIFGENVSFNNSKNRLIFSNELLKCKLKTSDENLAKIYEYHTYRELELIEDNLIDTVLLFISNNLIGQSPTLVSLSNTINIPTRTLQHYLKNKNTSYKKLVKKVRFQKAKELLITGENIDMISFLVGFKNTPAFYKAFKAEFSQTPLEFCKSTLSK